jgi:hypothetical protein
MALQLEIVAGIGIAGGEFPGGLHFGYVLYSDLTSGRKSPVAIVSVEAPFFIGIFFTAARACIQKNQ